eukprot:3942480-Amphidinium_carterae.2
MNKPPVGDKVPLPPLPLPCMQTMPPEFGSQKNDPSSFTEVKIDAPKSLNCNDDRERTSGRSIVSHLRSDKSC